MKTFPPEALTKVVALDTVRRDLGCGAVAFTCTYLDLNVRLSI